MEELQRLAWLEPRAGQREEPRPQQEWNEEGRRCMEAWSSGQRGAGLAGWGSLALGDWIFLGLRGLLGQSGLPFALRK